MIAPESFRCILVCREFARHRSGQVGEMVTTGKVHQGWPHSPEGEPLHRLRGVIAALLVGAPLAIFLELWLHAAREVAALIASGVGVAIFAVVATGRDAHDDAADQAWREAALDLPPVSDRIVLARVQASMPGPEKRRRASAVPKMDRDRGSDIDVNQGVEPK
jgi:hypothetical protein